MKIKALFIIIKI